MAQALPSFEELLSSLHLKGDAEEHLPRSQPLSPTASSFISSPSSSCSATSSHPSPRQFLAHPAHTHSLSTAASPSIIVSQPSPTVEDPLLSRRRSSLHRYSPYVPASVFQRRRSLPGDLSGDDETSKSQSTTRASSSSPPASKTRFSLHPDPHRPKSASVPQFVRAPSETPISAHLRGRRSGLGSTPASPSGRRGSSPTSAVSIPSLPPLPPMAIARRRSHPVADAPAAAPAREPHSFRQLAPPGGDPGPSLQSYHFP